MNKHFKPIIASIIFMIIMWFVFLSTVDNDSILLLSIILNIPFIVTLFLMNYIWGYLLKRWQRITFIIVPYILCIIFWVQIFIISQLVSGWEGLGIIIMLALVVVAMIVCNLCFLISIVIEKIVLKIIKR